MASDLEEAIEEVEDRCWQHLVKCTAGIYTSPEFTDLTLKCREKIWQVHRAIVCLASPVLARECTNTKLKANDGNICLPDLVPSAVGAMLAFLHTADYDDTEYDESEYIKAEDSSPLLFNVYVHAVGVQLEMPALSLLAPRKFGLRFVKEILRPYTAEALREVYSSPSHRTKNLRELVMQVCEQHSWPILVTSDKLSPDDLYRYRSLRRVSKELTEFWLQVTMSFWKTSVGNQRQISMACEICSQKWLMNHVIGLQVLRRTFGALVADIVRTEWRF